MSVAGALARYAYYPCAVALAVVVIAGALDAAALMRLASASQSLDGATELAWKSMLEKFSFSMYSGATDARQAYEAVVADAQSHARRATLAAAVLATLTAAQLLVVHRARGGGPRDLAWHATLVSAVAFGVGITAPMLTVLAYSNLPVLGTVVFRYDTKSILSTVGQLVETRNVLLGGLIALFSIVLPLAKMSLMATALAPVADGVRGWSLRAMHAVGRWSMADVFVVAVLVAFLALSKDEYSDARVGLGLYFFAAYCLLSMIAAHYIASLPAPVRERPA